MSKTVDKSRKVGDTEDKKRPNYDKPWRVGQRVGNAASKNQLSPENMSESGSRRPATATGGPRDRSAERPASDSKRPASSAAGPRDRSSERSSAGRDRNEERSASPPPRPGSSLSGASKNKIPLRKSGGRVAGRSASPHRDDDSTETSASTTNDKVKSEEAHLRPSTSSKMKSPVSKVTLSSFIRPDFSHLEKKKI